MLASATTSSSVIVFGKKACSIVDYSSSVLIGHTEKAFILSPGLGDLKEEYRFLGPKLAKAYPDHRVISIDLRGMGNSDIGFPSYTPEDTGNDIIAVVKELQLQEVIFVGCSMSAASILIPAAESCLNHATSYKTKGLIFLSPFAWDHAMPFGIPTLLNMLLNSWTGAKFWVDYYQSLYTLKPSPVTDLTDYCQQLKQNIQLPGHIEAIRGHMFGSKASCTQRIGEIAKDIPLLTIYGSKDPDFPVLTKEIDDWKSYFPQQTNEQILVIEGVGHYPHVEAVEEVFQAIVRQFVV